MFDNPREKVGLFIDAANLNHMQKALGFRIDFDKFRSFFANCRSEGIGEGVKPRLVFAGFYTAVAEDERGHRHLQPLLDFLSDHGYTTITKPAKYFTQDNGVVLTKGNMDVEIVCDIMDMVPHLDRVILVSGDGDYEELAKRVLRKGVVFDIVASRRAGMLSNELRKAASSLIDLDTIRSSIS